jgi:omega-6 fatty acid desaturase (delta-12 desaturase)
MASLICQISLILWIGVAFAPQKSPLELMILGWLIPFLSWNQIMGFVVYLHHTHPQVPWLLPDDSVRFFDRSILVTPHFHFPFGQDLALGIISGHTAHHCYSRVPFPNLKAAQEILIERSEVIQEDFSIAKYLETTAICKLYDFDRNCWTDFNGIPTSIIHNLSNYKL